MTDMEMDTLEKEFRDYVNTPFHNLLDFQVVKCLAFIRKKLNDQKRELDDNKD